MGESEADEVGDFYQSPDTKADEGEGADEGDDGIFDSLDGASGA